MKDNILLEVRDVSINYGGGRQDAVEHANLEVKKGEILAVVGEIPEGRVASYGQIATLIGRAKNSRLVGKVLSRAELYGDYPCHRVVNHAGRTAPAFMDQRMLLEQEGIVFRANGCVDMNQFQWDTD